ncbi:MAG TPA: carbohydrate ABC transporter permease [Candidatus Dormibacteraeota bacterium]|nr:carbohydrate ABC transporter permease [Candidatus Dormibacteraeota bacterium]
MSARIWRRASELLPRYVVLVPIAALFAFPFYWMLVISLGTLQSVFVFPPILYPLMHWENYLSAVGLMADPSTGQYLNIPWARYFLNTVIVATGTTGLVLITSVLGGYAFASIPFPGKTLIFGLVLAVYMVPTEVTLVPNFIILADLHWIDSYQAQIVPFGASVFGIFLMRQFFLGLPKDLWESAQLDGTGHLRFLWLIAAPLARPPIVTIALFHFVASWNAFLWPLIVTNSDTYRPVQVGLQAFSYADATNPVLHAAGSLMVTLPILIMFLLAQRQIVGGIAASGIRG